MCEPRIDRKYGERLYLWIYVFESDISGNQRSLGGWWCIHVFQCVGEKSLLFFHLHSLVFFPLNCMWRMFFFFGFFVLFLFSKCHSCVIKVKIAFQSQVLEWFFSNFRFNGFMVGSFFLRVFMKATFTHLKITDIQQPTKVQRRNLKRILFPVTLTFRDTVNGAH